jgi:hypothetical protein
MLEVVTSPSLLNKATTNMSPFKKEGIGLA